MLAVEPVASSRASFILQRDMVVESDTMYYIIHINLTRFPLSQAYFHLYVLVSLH